MCNFTLTRHKEVVQSSMGNAAGLNCADDQQQHRIHSNKDVICRYTSCMIAVLDCYNKSCMLVDYVHITAYYTNTLVMSHLKRSKK
jgi:hypothetical protein